MPPTTRGTLSRPSARMRSITSRTSGTWLPDRMESPTTCRLVDGGAHDCAGVEADALVDDLHAAVAGSDGDLLGAVGVAVEPGLPTSSLRRRPSRVDTASTSPRTSSSPAPSRSTIDWPTPVGARYSPKILRNSPPHSPVVTPASGARNRGLHDVAPSRAARQLGQRGLGGARVAARARQALSRPICSASTAASITWIAPSPAERATARSRSSG